MAAGGEGLAGQGRVYRHPANDLDGQQKIDAEDADGGGDDAPAGAGAVEEQEARDDPLDGVDQVFADEFGGLVVQVRAVEHHADPADQDYQRVEDEHEGQVRRHIPEQALRAAMHEPGGQDTHEEEVPGVEALDAQDVFGHVGVFHEGHQQDRPAQGVEPVAPGVDGQADDQQRDQGHSKRHWLPCPPTAPSAARPARGPRLIRRRGRAGPMAATGRSVFAPGASRTAARPSGRRR